MRALVCNKLGSTQNMVVEQRDDLEPGKGQVLIDVRGAGVNFPDILTVEGKYQFKPPLPLFPVLKYPVSFQRWGRESLLVQ